MLYIFHGLDAFSIRETVKGLQQAIGEAELQAVNTTTLPWEGLTPQQLAAICGTVPFLAQRRLVLVEGLLSQVEEETRRARREGAEAKGSTTAERWNGLGAMCRGLPPTTDLIFVESPLSTRNPLLAQLTPVATVRSFPPPTAAALRQWLLQRAAALGAQLTPQAIGLLVELVGPDLWAMSNELEKLFLYCGKQPVGEAEVRLLVSPAREASVFAAVDAILDRQPSKALELVYRLVEGGASVSYILAMLARQVRFLLLAKDLASRGVPQAQMGPRLGITSAFPLRKTLEQAARFTTPKLMALHQALLEADVAIKTGALGENLALEALVAELSGLRRG